MACAFHFSPLEPAALSRLLCHRNLKMPSFFFVVRGQEPRIDSFNVRRMMSLHPNHVKTRTGRQDDGQNEQTITDPPETLWTPSTRPARVCAGGIVPVFFLGEILCLSIREDWFRHGRGLGDLQDGRGGRTTVPASHQVTSSLFVGHDLPIFNHSTCFDGSYGHWVLLHMQCPTSFSTVRLANMDLMEIPASWGLI